MSYAMFLCKHLLTPANLSQNGMLLKDTSGGLVLAHKRAIPEVEKGKSEPLSVP